MLVGCENSTIILGILGIFLSELRLFFISLNAIWHSNFLQENLGRKNEAPRWTGTKREHRKMGPSVL